MPRKRRIVGAQLALLLAAACGSADGPSPADKAPQKAEAPAPDLPVAASHGFNDAIMWRSLSDGLAESARVSRPLMLLVHASWCSKCKALKPAFHDAEIANLAQRFVMVNVDQDKVPEVLSYAPDGTYIPRVIFISPETGEVDASLRNPKRDKHRYFYTVQDDLAGTMKKALERYGST